jgi:mono/diheme cytochrome c family protein
MRPLVAASALLAVAATLAPARAQERVPPVTNEAAKKECGACHMAYQPQLLPADSWRRIFADLGNHFGEDASLDDAMRQEILAYYVANAGSAGSGTAPLRITEQRWWQRKHSEEVRQADWAKAKFKGNCTACHARAEQGAYGD